MKKNSDPLITLDRIFNYLCLFATVIELFHLHFILAENFGDKAADIAMSCGLATYFVFIHKHVKKALKRFLDRFY